MWGATIFDQLVCRIQFHRMRYEGTFTPPSLQGTLVFPGNLGMFEWGGVAVDPVHFCRPSDCLASNRHGASWLESI
jgi:quinoprotein glucose dehydrogenase